MTEPDRVDRSRQWLVSPNRPKAAGRSTIRSWAPSRFPTRTRSAPSSTRLERKAVFKRAWLNVGRVEQLPRKGSYFTKELKVANTSIIVVRTTAGEVKAYHNICRHRGNKLVWNDMPLEETSGVCRQFTCKYHALALRPRRQPDLRAAGGRVLRPGQEPLRPGERALRRVGGVHLRQLSRRTRAAAARLPRPDDHRPGGLSVRPDDLAVLLPLGGEGELEALHGRVPGVLPRTGSAREPVAGEVLEGRRRSGFRGAALPHRRSASAGQHLGHSRLGDGLRDAQADGGHLPERAVRTVGQTRSRRHARRASIRRNAIPGAWIRSSCSRTS